MAMQSHQTGPLTPIAGILLPEIATQAYMHNKLRASQLEKSTLPSVCNLNFGEYVVCLC